MTSAAFLGVLVLFAKPRQNTVLKCAWLGLLALLLVPQAGSVLNGISYVSNRWVWAFTMLEAFILARVCPGITAFEPKEKRNLFALLAVYCVVAFCVKQGRTEPPCWARCCWCCWPCLCWRQMVSAAAVCRLFYWRAAALAW